MSNHLHVLYWLLWEQLFHPRNDTASHWGLDDTVEKKRAIYKQRKPHDL